MDASSSAPARAVVTGGAGFIGSNLVDALVARGVEVDVLDDLSSGSKDNLAGALAAGARLHEVDVRDGRAIAELVDAARPEVVFHLAAQIDVRRSVDDPAFDAEVNVGGTINVLEAARAAGARVVFSSTGGAIYGDAATIPTSEDARELPLAPYGASKLCAERYCGLFARLHDVSVVSLRYANVYGPRQDPLGEGGVIAIFCGRLLAGAQPTIFGDGTQTRDFVHVDDIVAANLSAAVCEVRGEINIGTGVETTVLELANLLAPHARESFTPIFAPARAGELERSCLDPGRAARVLPWTASIDVREGVDRTLAALR